MKEEKVLDIIRKDIRCPYCGKLLLKAKLWGNYNLQMMCPRCKNMIELSKYEKKDTNLTKK